MKIEQIPVSQIFAHKDFSKVVEAYCSESGNPDLGSAMPSLEWYERMEGAGLFRICGAFDDDRLVGVVSVTAVFYPHFGKVVASCESIWLDKDYRKGTTGLRLINKAKAMAKEMGAVGIYFGAREDSRLSQMYERMFVPMNRLYWKKL